MASTSTSVASQPVMFTTQTPYPLPPQKFMIPGSWKRYQLSKLVNKALSLTNPVPFDFLVRGEILRSSLGEWCADNGVGEVLVRVLSERSARLIIIPRKNPSRLNISNLLCRPNGCRISHIRNGSRPCPASVKGMCLSLAPQLLGLKSLILIAFFLK